MDKALKQRLVGASVLIALAVIVLPMLLGGKPDGAVVEHKEIELPQEPSELSFETRRYPIGDTGAAAPDSGSEQDRDTQPKPLPAPKTLPAEDRADEDRADESLVDREAQPGEEVAITALGPPPGETAPEVEAAGEPVPGTEIRPTTAPVPQQSDETDTRPVAETPQPADGAGRYVVQVASFGAADNANRLSSQLSEKGYSVLTDTVKSDVGTLHRVRVGPYSTESEARKTVVALSASIDGVKPRVMDLEPHRAAQVTTPEDPLVRWVVQVGIFSNEANAENVLAQLRLNGMTAYRETVTSSGSEVFRVRVGPFLNRQEAMEKETEISSSLSVSAVVMSID